MFILSIIILGGLAIYIFIARYTYKVLKKEHPDKKYISKIVLAVFILIPTYDIVITNVLAGYYCLTTPSTYIKKKVEFPESIYWEDNVYPGFNEEDRKLMIINYLDGKHLKTMALNGDDGKIYVYSLEKPIWEEIKKEFNEKELYVKGFDKYTQIIMQNEKIYTKSKMPKLNYTVIFNEVKLNSLASKFLYSDETKVIDNTINETIAYNRRIMNFFYNLLPDVAKGNIYYVDGSMCGDNYFWFEKKVLQTNGVSGWASRHKIGVSEYLYKKYIKGEK